MEDIPPSMTAQDALVAIMIAVSASHGAVRTSELVAIQVRDILGPDADGAASLFIPTSKTDRAGEGALAYVSPRTMAAIRAWRKAADIRSGPLLRRVACHADGSVRQVGEGALHPNSITLIYRRLIRDAAAKKLLGPISEAELARYDAVIHLSPPPEKDFYQATNVRTENLQQAFDLDDRILKIWEKHPNRLVIPREKHYFEKAEIIKNFVEKLISE